MIEKLRRLIAEHPFACVFAAGCALRLLRFHTQSLWFDETATLYISRAPLARVVPLVADLEANPPLHYLFMHFWTMLFSDPVLGLRAFSLLCGAASLAAFISLCRRLIPREALFASLLACVSSFWIHFSQDGRIYSQFLLLALLQTRLLVHVQNRWSLKTGAAYVGLGVAGLYTHNFFIFQLAAHFAYLAARRGGERRAPGVWLALYGSISALYAPWLCAFVSQIRLLPRTSLLIEPLTLRQLCRVTGTMLFDTSFLGFAHDGWTMAVGAMVLAAIVAGAVMAMRRGGPDCPLSFCLTQLAVPLLALRLAEFVLHRALTQTRYLIFLSPALYIGLAATTAQFRRTPARLLRLGLLIVMGAGAAGYYFGSVVADPRLPLLSEFIRRKSDSRRPVVYLDPYYYLPMRYHYLPQRAHFMAGPDAKIVHWEKIPGYAAYPPPMTLARLGECVVIDPGGRLSMKNRAALASGRLIAEAMYPESFPRARSGRMSGPEPSLDRGLTQLLKPLGRRLERDP